MCRSCVDCIEFGLHIICVQYCGVGVVDTAGGKEAESG